MQIFSFSLFQHARERGLRETKATPLQVLGEGGSVDNNGRKQMVWKQKEKSVSETPCFVSETEQQEDSSRFCNGLRPPQG